MSSWVFGLSCLLLLLLPLPLGANRMWAAGLFTPLFTLITLLWATAVWRGRAPWPRFSRAASVFFGGFGLLCLWFEVTRHWVSFDDSASLWHVNQLWLMLGVSLPMYACVQERPERAQALVWVLVLSAVLQTVLGIALFIGGRDIDIFFETVQQGVVKGSFVNRNHLASYLNIALGCGAGLMVGHLAQHTARAAGRNGLRRTARVAFEFMLSDKMMLRMLLVVAVVGLIGTRSRAGNGIFFSGVLLTGAVALWAFRQSSGGARSRVAIFFASVVVIDVLVLGAFVGLDKVVDRFQASYVTNQRALAAAREAAENAAREGVAGPAGEQATVRLEETLEARVSPAWPALGVLTSRPLTGTGGKTFQWVFPHYKDETAVGLHYEHAHNDYLEHLVEGGLIGFGLLAAMSLAAVYACLHTALSPGRSVKKGLALGFAMALLMTLAHCVVDFPTQIFSIAVTLCAVASAGLALSVRREGHEHR